MNPHIAYLDENNIRHDVWFLDGVTALNQMRAAQSLGIDTFALWRLGSEDRSLWAIWDKPGEAVATTKLNVVPPGQDVDIEGKGEILHIQSRPASGERQVVVDPNTNLVTDEIFKTLPSPYTVDMYGSSHNKIAITFDDGPDPEWTPKILDVLKEKGVKATFFLIGVEAEKNPAITKRIYAEGHEIGNHTFTHPDISNVSKRYFEVELNLTERLFEGKLGVKPVLFRPPYSIDQEPDTADQVRPLELAQQLGYITVGDKIDPNDWRDNPRRPADEIVADVLKNLPPCAPGNLTCGNVLLLHDGGGDRSETLKALPADHRWHSATWLRDRSGVHLAGQDPRRCHAADFRQRALGIVDRRVEFLAVFVALVVHHLRVLRRRRSHERAPGAHRCSGEL